MSVLDLYALSLVGEYLSAVDFVHLIKTCRYIHDKNISYIPLKRKQSPVKFMGIDDEVYRQEERGYKLPNGKLEGKYEVFIRCIYQVSSYTNGKVNGFITCYRLGDSSDASGIDKIHDEFKSWKDIDLSKMILEYRRYEDGSLVPVPGRPTNKDQVIIPAAGSYIFDIYPEALCVKEHIFMYRYVDGIIKDIWINETCGEDLYQHMDIYHHISFTDKGKMLRGYYSKRAGPTRNNLISSKFVPLDDPEYYMYDESYVFDTEYDMLE